MEWKSKPINLLFFFCDLIYDLKKYYELVPKSFTKKMKKVNIVKYKIHCILKLK